MPFTVPEALHPCIRAHQRPAYDALCPASSRALTRLAADERFLGTDRPGFPGVLHTWGRPLQYHPHIHYIVPGGGLSKDRTTWRPSRAIFKAEMRQAGLLAQIDPQGWTLPWNVPSQADHHGHAACPYLAPDVFRVALSHHRLVSRKDRTVTFTYRTGGRTRPRTAHFDGMELLRRFLQHVLPDGLMKVRPCGWLHASGAVPLATIRLLMGQGHPSDDPPPPRTPPPPCAARWPTCGASMRLIMRRGTSHRDYVDTGEEA
ncbi:MAG: transposase [Candidatus Tectimicrobiota bacterium]